MNNYVSLNNNNDIPIDARPLIRKGKKDPIPTSIKVVAVLAVLMEAVLLTVTILVGKGHIACSDLGFTALKVATGIMGSCQILSAGFLFMYYRHEKKKLEGIENNGQRRVEISDVDIQDNNGNLESSNDNIESEDGNHTNVEDVD